MSIKAIPSHGTLLKMGDGGTGGAETFTVVAECGDWKGPALSTDEKDVTTHDAPNFEQVIPTLLKGGELTTTLYFIPTEVTHAGVLPAATDASQDVPSSGGLYGAWKARTVCHWQLVFPDENNSYLAFTGFVSGLSLSAPVTGAVDAELKLRTTQDIPEVHRIIPATSSN